MYNLVLLRHGETEWNQLSRFCGWVDVKLSEKGKTEAAHAGALLKKHDYLPRKAYSSMLTRAIQSVNLALENCDRAWVEVTHTYRMNERHYGALQGRPKKEIEAHYGHDKYMQFRRSLDIGPPAIDPKDEFSQVDDPRYAFLRGSVPLTENLHQMADRIKPEWEDCISNDLRRFGTVLVVGHGNSLRGLIRIVRKVSNDEIKKLDLVTGVPFVIKLDEDLNVIDPENWCEYLD